MAVISNNQTLTNPSTRTLAERRKFAGMVDSFATFTWDHVDMFNEFGMFIINEKKGSLKMYNGASFKNEYSKPQFQNGYTNITGITFDTQKISFTAGIYWFSIEDYRVLMNFLHPYKVAYLGFDFESEYGYYCKLSAIKDSTRYVVGKETASTNDAAESDNLKYSQLVGSDQSGYRYYTELQLTFEVIGAQCAKSLQAYIANLEDWVYTTELTNHIYNYAEQVVSDLDMPLQIHLNFTVPSSVTTSTIYTISGQAYINYIFEDLSTRTNTVNLFSIQLKNLRAGDSVSLVYDAEQGLMYWKTGEKENILSLLSTNDSGMRIVNSLDVKQFAWPGQLNHKEVKEGEKHLLVTTNTALSALQYTRQKRTNVL